MMISSRSTIRTGFRFHPSVEELLCHYLEKKNQGSTDSQITHIIPEIGTCKHEPRALPALVFKMAEFLDKETYYSYTQWYFFSPLHYKYNNSTRSNRTTEQGYWKITGKELVIMARGSKVEIGRKRTLTFYQRRGETKAKKTDWVMHEYYRTAKGKQMGDFVLCCLKNKSDKFDHDKDAPFFDGGEPGSGSSSMASNVENQAASNVMITEAEEFRAYKELGDAVQIPNDNEDAFNGLQTNCVEGQLDSCNPSDSDMIDELLDDVKNLDSLFLQGPPPQPHQLPQPHPPIYEQLGNVSHSTNVSNDESRKRNYPFGDNDPSLTKKKKKNTSADDDDELGSKTASNSENQAVAKGMATEAEENQASKELGNVSNGNHDEAEPCSHMLTEEEEIQAFQELRKLLDDHEPENLDPLFPQPPPPQPHQLPQPPPPQNYHPSTLQSPIYEQLGNVSHSTNVSNDESHKRNCPFGDTDPSRTKKNTISTDDDDELGSNTASNSENQAAHGIPEGYSQPEANLGLVWWDQPQPLLSINGGPRDSFQNNKIIELDVLPSSFEDIGSFLAKFSDIIDRSSGVSSDRNTEVAHGSKAQNINIIQCPIMASNMGGAPKKNPTAEQHHKPRSVKLQRHYIAIYLPQKKLKPSPGSRQQFKDGSNLKGSFIFLDASPFNP